uniref:CCHC-type domain-containing protein n=1 Tax=Lactuca sativa TaxID=4236 RepID=A0A9R1XE96_LACSA|nr:hypothetical protein LSAT_V11C400205260 [Lactuca sativa]
MKGAQKRMLVEEYCPREEIHKLEQELWTLTMKGSEINAYTDRFNDLVVMCPALVTSEYKKIEQYIWSLASQIKGMVITSKPTTYNSAKCIAHQLTSIEIQLSLPNLERTSANLKGRIPYNHLRRDNMWKLIIQCNHQHAGDCYIYMKCKKKGHTANYCRSTTTTTGNQGTNIGIGYDGGRACFKCGEIGHIKKECPKLRSQGS